MNRLKFEIAARDQGYQIIAGVDEVGRGCLAGPVVAAAVILPFKKNFPGVNDSKQLSPQQREILFVRILKQAVSFGFGVVEPAEIDRMNISRASLKAMRLAIENLNEKPDYVLVDGLQIVPLLAIPQQAVVKGDCFSLSVAAASILAKVHRDRLMGELAKEYPQYAFEIHKGYGTRTHWEALQRFGPSPIHRLSYRGVGKEWI
ncbi:MAG: ribonuclease HII [Deltaproteobacteria bacterium]|nr:ribonuclease HII [Deltaproteobacteria bacterium]